MVRRGGSGYLTGRTESSPHDAAVGPLLSAGATPDSTAALDGSLASGGLPPESAQSRMEPTFATGGCLWFPDLTVADPYHVLPLALSAVLVTYILTSPGVNWRTLLGMEVSSTQRRCRWPADSSSRLQRTFLVLSCTMGITTMHLPCAIHLYWLSSSCTSLVLLRAVRRFHARGVVEGRTVQGEGGHILATTAAVSYKIRTREACDTGAIMYRFPTYTK